MRDGSFNLVEPCPAISSPSAPPFPIPAKRQAFDGLELRSEHLIPPSKVVQAAAAARLHDLSVAVNAGFPSHEIGGIIRHLRSHRDELLGAWNEHFGN
jgi:hypothetical protein